MTAPREEFWLTHMRAPYLSDGRLWTREWEEGKVAAHARVDALPLEERSPADLRALADAAALYDLADNPNDVVVPEEYAEALREALHAAVDAVWPASRSFDGGASEVTMAPDEIAQKTIGGVDYWFTGGITSGEVPSDLWDAMNLLEESALFEAPLEVAIEIPIVAPEEA